MSAMHGSCIVVTAAKGGIGTSVTAAGLAVLSAERRPTLLVDLAGDQPLLFGHHHETAPLGRWLDGDALHPDAMARLETTVAPDLSLLVAADDPNGVPPARLRTLGQLLGVEGRTVVVDAGVSRPGFDVLGEAATRTYEVVRPCYLGLRAAAARPAPDGLVLINERGRVLGRRDVADAIGVPVVVELWRDPAVARAVDAGLFGGRRLRSLRPLEALL